MGARVCWLGQLMAVWTHQLSSGALLLFAFFMISDPITGPNARRGRIAHAAIVATIALVWQFGFYLNNGLIWALFLAAPAVPMWDLLWPAAKFEWMAQGESDEIAHRVRISGGNHSDLRDRVRGVAA
jgi:Na+-translocating ferredoxin:NAD+ oxidoreductase RnfD subunit